MDITPLVPEGRQVIESYGDEGFRINGERYPGPVLVWPERVVPWAVPGLDRDAAIETLEPVFAAEPRIDILLFGSGAAFALAPAPLRQALGARGIATESMENLHRRRLPHLQRADGRGPPRRRGAAART